ncbi:MAG: hypothetical protein ABIO47_06860 [Sphingomicrobium sp.]
MNSGEIMVVLIVAIVMISSIFKGRVRRDRSGGSQALFHYDNKADPDAAAENRRLRQEVDELKERLKVLERITVDKENSLSRQIEELRDR